MSFVSLQALCASCTGADSGLDKDPNIRLVGLFDHEGVLSAHMTIQECVSHLLLFFIAECGSGSAVGADSNLLAGVLARLNAHTNVESSARRSFLISADMAHACHPNWAASHEDAHRPMMNQGLVFKENANQRYATNAATAFVLNEIARRNQITVQDFCVRNDAMCGSTVGPILSANCGVRCVDVGVPQVCFHVRLLQCCLGIC